MSAFSALLFDTALGRCGLAWGPGGLAAASFPCADDEATLARLARRAPGAVRAAALLGQGPPPDDIAALAASLAALVAGAAGDGDLQNIGEARLDWSGVPAFDRAVLELARAVAPGTTRTYGDLARALGDVGLSRRVGQALGRNPFPIVVPCHRILGADGRLTGFSAPGGLASKRRLLKIEGALAPDLFD